MVLFGICHGCLCQSRASTYTAQSGWISPADLMHMRIGDVSAFKPETQLQYVGHLKPGIYIKAGRFVGLTQ